MDRGGDESAVASVEEHAAEGAGVLQDRAVVDRVDPVVDSKVIMKPDRVIEARGLRVLVHDAPLDGVLGGDDDRLV